MISDSSGDTAAEGPAEAEAIDSDFLDASTDVACMDDLVAIAERSAHLIDDGMNETESEEERNAAAEGQAMR